MSSSSSSAAAAAAAAAGERATSDQQQQRHDHDPRRQYLTDEARARIKDSGRDSRLSFKKFAEYQLRKELKEIALERCRGEVQAFGRCAQEQGLMVVWRCRDKNRAVNECLALHNSEEEWQKYRALHKEDIDRWESKSSSSSST